MIRNIIFFILVLLAYAHAQALNLLKGVETTQENNQTVTVYEFTEPFDPTMVQTNIQDKVLQVIFPNAEMPTDKNSIHVGNGEITGVDSTFDNLDMIRSNINFVNALTNVTGESIKVVAENNKLKIYVAPEVAKPSPLESQPVLVKSAATAKDKKNISESEIPVLASAKTAKVVPSSQPYLKLMLSLLLIVALSGGLIFFSKWYAKNSKKGANNNKIRILTQHALGPRKQLMIVRVAGESMLLGVTDHSISMLKSLSLIDDEIPAQLPNDFGQSLETADLKSKSASEKADVEVDEFVISGIKDKISTKLKGMRDI